METTEEKTFQFPASKDQERLWILSKFKQVKGAYNMPGLVHIKGKLEPEILRMCIADLLARHEPLRTSFIFDNDQLFQTITDINDYELPVVRLTDKEAIDAFVQVKIHAAPDLEKDRLFNVYLIDKGDSEYMLLVLLHHSIADGWSLNVLLRDLSAFYTQRLGLTETTALPILDIQYVDYVGSEMDFLDSEDYHKQIDFWKKYLDKSPELLELPTIGQRKKIQTYTGKTLQINLEKDLTLKLRALSAKLGTSSFVTLLAVFKVLLSRYSGQDDITVGTLYANRERKELEHIIGFLVKTLPVRTKLDQLDTFQNLVSHISQDFTNILKNKEISFYDIVKAANAPGNSGHNPVFQALFSYENLPDTALQLGDLQTSIERMEGTYSKFDLTLNVTDKTAQEIILSFEYNTDLFEDSFIHRLKEGFISILTEMTVAPSTALTDIDGLSSAERNVILYDWNDTNKDFGNPGTFPDLFAEMAIALPDQPAVLFGDSILTYEQLDTLSGNYASYLSERGIRKGDFVCLIFERNGALLPILLAIMKIGAIYVPIDPLYPKERVSYIISHSGSKFVLSHRSLKNYIAELGLQTDLIFIEDALATITTGPVKYEAEKLSEASIAYCIYTSGSTGLPKGVAISHGALANFLRSMQERPGIAIGDRLLAVTSISFDISGLELYLPLICGATTIVCRHEAIIDPEKLIAVISQYKPTVIQATPSLFKMLKEVNWTGDKQLKVLCGGESVPKDLALWLKKVCGSVWNMYGPTETTIWSLTHEFDSGIERVTIGKPIANTQVFILNKFLKPVPAGIAGDLYLGGKGLANSYHRDEEQTAKKFINWEFENIGQRLYKTGDRAKYDQHGNVYFMGREDFQIKLNGYRIELEEIEVVLSQVEGIGQAIVLVDEFGAGNQQLVAYFENNGLAIDLLRVRSEISTRLPKYMIPAKFVSVEKFPVTANGKIDRNALRIAENTELAAAGKTLIEPGNEEERMLLGIWKEVLNQQSISTTDDFLSLGGSSISSVKIAAMASAQGMALSPEMIFEYPTIKELAMVSSRSEGISIGAGILAQPEELSLLGSLRDISQSADSDHVIDVLKKNMVIESIGKYLPEIEVSATDIVNGCSERIRFPMQRITGIESVRNLPEGKDSLSLAIEAIQQCLSISKYQPEDIDLIISCGIFRLDGKLAIQIDPSFSYHVKQHFGMSNAQNFDISNACAGIFTGLVIAESFLKNNSAKKCLIFSSEYLSHVTKTAQREVEGISDRKIAALTAGDAGLAMIVELGENGETGFQDLDLFTMGEYSDLCIIQPTERAHGGFIIHTDAIRMGEAGYIEAARHALNTLEKNRWGVDFDHFIMHQASSTTILNATRELNKFFNKEVLHSGNIIDNIKNRGNTASTTYFLATIDNMINGRIKANEKVIYSVSGSGLNLGTALYKFDDLPDRVKKGTIEKLKVKPVNAETTVTERPRVQIRQIEVDFDPKTLRSGMEMLYSATEKTLKNLDGPKNEIDLVLYYGTLRDDYIYEPAIASFLTGKTNINSTKELVRAGKSTFAFDIYNGSMGFLSSCQVASELIISGKSNMALLASSEVDNNRQYGLDSLDIVEAGTALILTASDNKKGFGNFEYASIARISAGFPESSFYSEWQDNKLIAKKIPSEKLHQQDFNAIEAIVEKLLDKENLILSDLDDVLCAMPVDDSFPAWIQERNVISGQFDWPSNDPYNLSLPLQFEALMKSGLQTENRKILLLDIANVKNRMEIICSIYYA